MAVEQSVQELIDSLETGVRRALGALTLEPVSSPRS